MVDKQNIENVIIVGAGISGLSAAVYTSRGALKPLVIGGMIPGGQLMLTTEVENFPGFEHGIKGPELIDVTRKQAERFGTRIRDIDVLQIKPKKLMMGKDGNEEKTVFDIVLEKNEMITTKSVIIATGSKARMLDIPGEKEFWQRGVSTCATCDGYFFKDREVAVIGGGDSACEEALFLSKLTKQVTLIHRRDSLRASKIMQERIFNNPKVKVIWNSLPIEVLGDKNGMTGLKLKDTNTGAISEVKLDGMFLGIGHSPNTDIFKGIIDIDDKGYIKATNTKTSVRGIFACGDVVDSVYRQAVVAAGDGARAALEVERYLEAEFGHQ